MLDYVEKVGKCQRKLDFGNRPIPFLEDGPIQNNAAGWRETGSESAGFHIRPRHSRKIKTGPRHSE
jgi:hypothetical protein